MQTTEMGIGISAAYRTSPKFAEVYNPDIVRTHRFTKPMQGPIRCCQSNRQVEFFPSDQSIAPSTDRLQRDHSHHRDSSNDIDAAFRKLPLKVSQADK
jgi:hypothetical protein